MFASLVCCGCAASAWLQASGVSGEVDRVRRLGIDVHSGLGPGHLDLEADGLPFEERSECFLGLRESRRGCGGRHEDPESEGSAHDDLSCGHKGGWRKDAE